MAVFFMGVLFEKDGVLKKQRGEVRLSFLAM
jgi:hypothetical protein